MTTGQQRALVALLEEGDDATISLVKKELVFSGAGRLTELHELLSDSTECASRHLQEVIDQIESSRNLGDISRGLARLKTFEQLEDLCWEFARAEQPTFDGGPYSRQLDSWGAALKSSLTPKATEEEQVRALTRYLAYDQRLSGNHQDYYHPRNSYLPWVLEFRHGLPPALTLIYILVGRRAGLEVEGVSAPGHFLARIGTTCFDPYYSGRIISEGEWERILSEIPVSQRDVVARACTPLQMVHRLLINLRNAYIKRNDLIRQQRIDRYLAVLQR